MTPAGPVIGSAGYLRSAYLAKARTSRAPIETLAEEIITKRPGRDLPLTKEEQVLLRNAYAKAQADFPDLGVASTTLTASSGVELDFEVCIGDAGEPQNPQSPYDLRNGNGFDSSNYIEVE